MFRRGDVIRAGSVTTEFNTLFETVTSIASKVDPIKLNQTLTATAQALDRPRDQIRRVPRGRERDPRRPEPADAAAPRGRRASRRPARRLRRRRRRTCSDGLDAAVTTARTLNAQRGDVDAALMAAVGFAETAADPLERAGPYLVRGAADLVPTTELLDDYRAMIFCTVRNYHDVGPRIAQGTRRRQRVLAGGLRNGHRARAIRTSIPTTCRGSTPAAAPRAAGLLAEGHLRPVAAPVSGDGHRYSIAPYNHAEIGQPMAIDYVWGRQIGELTINP